MESISINDWLWVQWKSHLVSFNYKGLAKGVHFTIAFNENSQYVNLHLTKNIEILKPKKQEKPKIEICKISKVDFNEIAPKISLSILSHILEEVKELENYQDYYFISFEEIEKEGIQKGIEKTLFENFKDITNLKQNKRLKIKGKIENRLENFSKNEKIQELLLNKLEIFEQTKNKDNSNGGILFSEKEILSLFKFHNKWYKFNTEIDVNLLLKDMFGNQLLEQLKTHITDSIKIIEKANDYQDCAKYDRPIILRIEMPAANN